MAGPGRRLKPYRTEVVLVPGAKKGDPGSTYARSVLDPEADEQRRRTLFGGQDAKRSGGELDLR
jgi:hypothetical protein